MRQYSIGVFSVCALATALSACGGAFDDEQDAAPASSGEVAQAAAGQGDDGGAPSGRSDTGLPAEAADPDAVEALLRPSEDDTPLSTLPFDPTEIGVERKGPPTSSLNVTCPEGEAFTWHDEVASNGVDIGWAVAASCDAVFQVGYTGGSIAGQANAGANDMFIRRLGKGGQVAWERQIGTAANDYATHIALSTDGCTPGNPPSLYVTGYTSGAIEAGQHKGSSDAFLIKLSANGTELWRRQIGTAGVDQAWAVAHAPDGHVYVVGSTAGNLAGVSPPPPAGTTSLFVTKFTASGGLVWTRQLGVNNKTSIARGVAVGANGTVYVAGYTSAALGGAAYQGGSADAFVAAYLPDGSLSKVALIGTGAQDQSYGIAAGVESGATVVYVSGYTNGNFPGYSSSSAYDAFLIKLDADLGQQWLRQTTASQNVSGNAVVLAQESVLLVGSTTRDLDSDAPLGSSDVYVRKYDTHGALVHTEYVGTNAKETAQGAAADPEGNIVLAGWTDANFCGHAFGGGGTDAITVRLLNGCLVRTPDSRCKLGGGWGDPHYMSFDQVAFDFQGSGDFWLARNAADPTFQVQVRQCPWWQGAPVATAQALGARVGNDIVEIGVNGSVLLDTVPLAVPTTRPVPLPSGGSVYRAAGNKIVVAWPGGERLVAQPVSSYMNVLLLIPPSRQGQMLGILGNADGDKANEFMMARDGSDLRSGLTFFEMYRDTVSYAGVWRVDPAQADVPLIQAGTPCDDPAAPGAPAWLNTLTPAQQAQGELACNGITDEALRQTCVLDVGLTGEAAFAQAAAEIAAARADHGQLDPITSSARSVYFNNFTGAIGSEWETIVTSITPLGDRTFMGQFGNETVALSLNNLGPHTELTVSFDLYLINGWDGDGPFGPNVWTASADGQELFSETFSNTFSSQSYPLDGSAGGTGALEVNTLLYPHGDSVYRMKLVFPHAASDLLLELSAAGLVGIFDEGWGIANVEVQGR